MADDIFTHEIWKEIPGLEHEHEASSLGRIRRIEDGQIMRQSESHGPYNRVWVRGCKRMRDVHGLVALAFHGPRPDKFHIDHKDHNTRNNESDNLEYVPPLENSRRGRHPYGNNSPNRVLSESDVELIRASNATLTELVEQFKASKNAIANARRGLTWRRVDAPVAPLMKSGEQHRNAILTEAAVKEIRESGANLHELSRRFQVCVSSVASARYGRTWKEVDIPPQSPPQEGRTKLTEEIVIEARAIWAEGRMGMNEIRRHLGLEVSWSCLFNALKGKTWKHLNQIAPLSATDHRKIVSNDLAQEVRRLLTQGLTAKEVGSDSTTYPTRRFMKSETVAEGGPT